jgi:hypothetical protein
MRRLLPWALVAFLLVGAAGGAGLGLAMQPAALTSGRALLERIFAVTEGAGSARFTFTWVTRSANPYLRSTGTGSGAIDFRTNASDVKRVDHSVSFSSTGGTPERPMSQSSLTEMVSVGKAQYERLPIGPPQEMPLWVKLPARAGLGINGIVPVLQQATEYGLIPGSPNLEVETIGPSLVGSVGTTEYVFKAVPACLVRSRPGQPHATSGPFEVWVDGVGRLIEARTTVTETAPASSLPGMAGPYFSGVLTTTSLLRLSDFGAPVRVNVPHVNRVVGVSIGIASVRNNARNCPSD